MRNRERVSQRLPHVRRRIVHAFDDLQPWLRDCAGDIVARDRRLRITRDVERRVVHERGASGRIRPDIRRLIEHTRVEQDEEGIARRIVVACDRDGAKCESDIVAIAHAARDRRHRHRAREIRSEEAVARRCRGHDTRREILNANRQIIDDRKIRRRTFRQSYEQAVGDHFADSKIAAGCRRFAGGKENLRKRRPVAGRRRIGRTAIVVQRPVAKRAACGTEALICVRCRRVAAIYGRPSQFGIIRQGTVWLESGLYRRRIDDRYGAADRNIILPAGPRSTARDCRRTVGRCATCERRAHNGRGEQIRRHGVREQNVKRRRRVRSTGIRENDGVRDHVTCIDICCDVRRLREINVRLAQCDGCCSGRRCGEVRRGDAGTVDFEIACLVCRHVSNAHLISDHDSICARTRRDYCVAERKREHVVIRAANRRNHAAANGAARSAESNSCTACDKLQVAVCGQVVGDNDSLRGAFIQRERDGVREHVANARRRIVHAFADGKHSAGGNLRRVLQAVVVERAVALDI